METKFSNPDITEDATATVSAPDLGLGSRECLAPELSDPCAIVIMGATGDLTTRKLMPALFDLYVNEGLPEHFLIVGSSRMEMDDQEFRMKMQSTLKKDNTYDETKWSSFAEMLYYCRTDVEDLRSFKELARLLRDLDEKLETGGNRIFYMALPPSVYKTAASMIGQVGLADENQNSNGWSRIVVEKPFGTDLKTAEDLDQNLSRNFREHQIFRIDHYLAKETVQNVLM